MLKKFIIAGGGTGGHIFPAIAIANAIKHKVPSAEILFIGAQGKMEMEKVPQAGYEIKGLDITGFNRSSLLKNISLPWKLIKSFIQVRTIFSQFKPTAVIGVGGYSTFPVLRYAQSKGIPTFIHEANSFAGKSNILLGKKATKIFVATEGMERFFPKENLLVSGNPVRDSIENNYLSRKDALAHFNLDESKTTILAVGGSLGAASINNALKEHLGELEKNNLQLIWQTGKTNAALFQTAAAQYKNVWVGEFITQMEYGYAAADMVISRAGAMAVTELCILGKAAILVPFPHAAEDHQTANAMQLVNNGAALIVKDADAQTQLVQTVIELSANPMEQEHMKGQIRQLALRNAADFVADQILESLT
jgi:UDP-N-acetylglucosamine--N-acetylmuramyl-(pentapeptide) pyrophosphoryl-undecaprenol N-acetylglucosamine transferase